MNKKTVFLLSVFVFAIAAASLRADSVTPGLIASKEYVDQFATKIANTLENNAANIYTKGEVDALLAQKINLLPPGSTFGGNLAILDWYGQYYDSGMNVDELKALVASVDDKIKNKADKPADAVGGQLAMLDWGGDYIDSGIARSDLLATLATIAPKADKSRPNQEMGGTAGNFAAIDWYGQYYDSLKGPGDFATAAQGARADTAVQPEQLATVATTGSWNDLMDKPNTSLAALYEIRSNSVLNAITGNEFYIDMDDLRFRAFKASTANYWGARIDNNSDTPISYASRGIHYYSGQQTNNKQGTLAVGAELNPDNEASDIGYSQGDAFITHFFDNTNMRLYRWTVQVNIRNAVMVVERLH
ncbi:MAG: hypothetical protein FWE52_04410 [Alphaproteobacteria bacterium]|nr:hypothetical protein [Alphaproteobacteria bacterium]